MPSYTLQEICEYLDARLVGNPSHIVSCLATLVNATGDQITFFANAKYRRFLGDTKAGAVLLSEGESVFFSGNKLICENPYLAYAKLSHWFLSVKPRRFGVCASSIVPSSASVAPSAFIGEHVVLGERVIIESDVVISPNCVIGSDVHIGKGSFLHPNITVYHQVKIGCNVVIHSGTVIGSDGFGFAKSQEGWVKIAQVGRVIIGDRVEIGACTSIDRGAIEDTIIEDGVIIDNQVQIAHNVRIGKNSAIAGCVGISGSTRIGENCTVAGAAGFAGHIELADNVHIGMQAQVTKSIHESGAYASGTGLMEAEDWRKMVARLRRFENFEARLKKLENGFPYGQSMEDKV